MTKTRWTLLALAAGLTLSLSPVRADELTETVHLVVTGGPHAGSWDSSSDRGGCSYGLVGPGSWGNQLSTPKDPDPKKFNSLQLIVPNTKAAAAGTKEFMMVVGFGPLMHRSGEYTIETRAAEKKKSGSGTVTIQDKGTTGKVSFSAITADGVKLEGTIDCKKVTRNGS